MILSVSAVARHVYRNRELTLGLTRRELFQPFAGSAFGVLWSLLHPLATMLVYLAVFGLVFKIRFSEASEMPLDYTVYVLSGLVSWMAWVLLLGSAGYSVLGSANLVRQPDFPTVVLPFRTALAAMVPHLVGLAVLLGYVWFRFEQVPWTWALLPVVMGIQFIAMLAVAYLLSALCVFVRDIKEVVVVFVGMGIFITPALYTPSMMASMPGPIAKLIQWNPFTHFVAIYRDVLFYGEITQPVSWAITVGLAGVLLFVCTRVFEGVKGFFGDFL